MCHAVLNPAFSKNNRPMAIATAISTKAMLNLSCIITTSLLIMYSVVSQICPLSSWSDHIPTEATSTLRPLTWHTRALHPIQTCPNPIPWLPPDHHDSLKGIGCSSLRGRVAELGTNKNLDIWLQLVCTNLKLKHAI